MAAAPSSKADILSPYRNQLFPAPSSQPKFKHRSSVFTLGSIEKVTWDILLQC
jgi:hypothetical protein